MNDKEKLKKIKEIVEAYFNDEYLPVDVSLESLSGYDAIGLCDTVLSDIKDVLEA